jgi:tetratricopeptide (TPR) repeat protein
LPTDREGTLTNADKLLREGQLDLAIAEYRRVADHLQAEGFASKAAGVFKKILKIAPGDEKAQLQLAQISARQGLLAEARGYLNAGFARHQSRGDTAAADPMLIPLLMVRLEVDLREGKLSGVRNVVSELLALDPKLRQPILSLAGTLADNQLEAASAAVETVADVVAAAGDQKEAAAILRPFAQAAPGRISALLKLVEICVDGGFEADTYDAQAQLAGAYLAGGRADEARIIFEDLVAHEPWDSGHIDGLRRSLTLLNVADVEAVISAVVNSEGLADVEGPDAGALADVREMTDAVEVDLSETRVPTVEPGPDLSSMEIDLTGILTDLRGLELPSSPPPAQDLERVFATMRENAERAEGDDAAGEYLALARSYLEMGLTTEAAAALENAVQATASRFEAASMLGKLAQQRGDLDEAIDWFERAAEVPAPSVDEGRALLYELGATLERAGEAARALAVFLELQADAGDYRDIASRIATLSRSQTGD